MTAEEKAEIFVKAIDNQGYDRDMVKLALTLFIIATQHDQREACGMAVLRLGKHAAVTCLIGDAHAAIMNCQGGLK